MSTSANATFDYFPRAFYALREFNRTYMLIVIAVGLIGNATCVVVFQTTRLRKTPSNHYLTALCISDFCVLLGNLAMRFHILQNAAWSCKALYFLHYVALFMSVWLVVAFTLERLIAVLFPLKVLKIATVRRALLIILALLAFAMTWNSQMLFIVTFDPAVTNNSCSSRRSGIFETYRLVFSYGDTAVTFVIPMILILVINLVIALNLRKSSHIPLHGDGNSQQHRSAHKEYTITKMLLIVSLVFVIMNLPDHIGRLVIAMKVEERFDVLVLLITNAWFNTGFAVNFFLYSIVGERFRFYLFKLIRKTVYRITCGLVILRKRSTRLTRAQLFASSRLNTSVRHISKEFVLNSPSLGAYRPVPAHQHATVTL